MNHQNLNILMLQLKKIRLSEKQGFLTIWASLKLDNLNLQEAFNCLIKSHQIVILGFNYNSFFFKTF